MVKDGRKPERAVPLTMEGYARRFELLVTRTSTEYDIMTRFTRSVISDNNFDEEPVKMLSVGAGRGHFEKRMVEELGLKLEYIYAIEPNPAHLGLLETALNSINAKYDIDPSFFDEKFAFNGNCAVKDQKFDFILFSHSLYAFQDPHGAVNHAVNFLKPGGKIVIFSHGGPDISDHLYNYVLERSDPEIFNTKLTQVNHGLTAQSIAAFMQEGRSDLNVKLMQDTAHIDVDEFVRGEENEREGGLISFFMQCEYRDLSEEARKEVYDIVVPYCELKGDRYMIRHLCAGVIISFK